jgi:hypothetical protein
LAETAEVDRGPAIASQVLGLILPPVAFGADLIISYSLVQHACSTGHHYILHVVTVIALVVALFSGFLSWRQYLLARDANDEGGSPLDRAHFLALMGMLTSLTFTIVIIANAVPRWVLHPCD